MAYLQRKNVPRKQRLCSVCNETCSFSYIFCDSCAQWLHTNCDGMAEDMVKQFESLPPDFPYVCKKCRCDEEGSLDYELSLTRLHKAAVQGLKKLRACVKREELFLDGPFVGVSGVGSLAVDLSAQVLMERYLRNDKGIPAAVSSADHVLFRAVSLAVCAKDSLACELRVRCCVEMVNFASYYCYQHNHPHPELRTRWHVPCYLEMVSTTQAQPECIAKKIFADSLACELRVRCCVEMVNFSSYYRYQHNHPLLARCAPDYHESCLDCALADEGSSVWTMAALASVVRRPIMSVFPNVNGPSDPAVQALNVVFQPREGQFNCQLVRILWSHEGEAPAPPQGGKWRPNHFVPLFDQQRHETAPSSSSNAASGKSPAKHEPDSGHNGDLDSEMDNLDDGLDREAAAAAEIAMEELEMDPIMLQPAEGGEIIEFGRFMDVFDAYEKITEATSVHVDIPRGVKENVFFLVDNGHNVNHPERRNTFFDDCGVWDSKHGSVAKSHLLLDDKGILCTLKIHGGVFKQLSKSKGKPEWVAIEPQPDPDRVVICHRYYAFLKRCPTYKRRIIWFTMPPAQPSGRDVALVEYLGKFPGFPAQRHGNARRGRGGSRNYIRTDPKLLEEISDQIRKGTSMTPMKLFKEMQQRLGPTCTLRDPRQIRNLKYSILKRARQQCEDEGGPHHTLFKQEVGGEEEEGVVVGVGGEENYTISINENGTEVVGMDESGQQHSVLTATTTTTATGGDLSKAGGFDQGLIKVIIHQGDGEMGAVMETVGEIPEGAEVSHAKLLDMGEGGSAISFMDTATDGTQTVIMVKDLNAALAAGAGVSEVVVNEAI